MPLIIEAIKEPAYPAVIQLLQANSASQNGGLLGEFPAPKVMQMIQTSLTTIVARENSRIAGVVFSFPLNTPHLPPLIAEINRLFPALKKDHWLYGPVCIDTDYRGKNLLATLFKAICNENSGNPIAFINKDNIRSIRAHEKLGMQTIAEFDFEGTPYVLVSLL